MSFVPAFDVSGFFIGQNKVKNLISTTEKQTMSSLEIAKLTGKQHKDVIESIRKTLSEVEINSADFSAQYKDASGKSNICFNLPRRECDLIIAGYSAKYRLAIIDRWQELETAQPKTPTTFIEAMQLATQLLIENEKKEQEIAKLNTLLDNEFGYCSILRAAKYAGVHETMFKWQALKARTIQLGYEVRQVPSPRFGYQNLYVMQAYRDCYPEIDFDDLTPDLIEDKQNLVFK